MAGTDVLIVEDEPITAMELRSTVEGLGYNVPGVVNRGSEALNVLEDDSVDLVLMDINLKGSLDGIETAREMRQDHAVSIVYLTAYSDENTLARAEDTEPEGYLVKPVTEDDLRSTLTMALARRDDS